MISHEEKGQYSVRPDFLSTVWRRECVDRVKFGKLSEDWKRGVDN